MRGIAAIMFLTVFCGSLLTARAQGPDSLSGGVLSDALVAARAVPEDRAYGGQSASGAILRSTPTLADVVRLFSGVQLKDYGGVGGLKTINVRSLGSEHVGVYIDGMPVENAQNMQVDLGRFLPEAFGRMELVSSGGGAPTDGFLSARERGSAGALYLSAALPSLPQGKNNLIRARLRGGSFGTFAPSLGWDAGRGRVRSSLNLALTSTSGRYRFHSTRWQTSPTGAAVGYDTVLTRRNGDLLSALFQEVIEGPAGSGTWRLTAYGYDSERGLPGPVVRRGSSGSTTKDRQRDRDFFLQGRMSRNFGPYGAQLRAKYSGSYTRYRTNPDEDPQALPYDNRYTQNSGYLSLSHRLSILPGLELSAASDVQYAAMASNLRNFARPRRLTLWNAAGARGNWKWGEVEASALWTAATDRFTSYSHGEAARESGSRSFFSPSLSLSVRPAEMLTVFGYLRRTSRLPSFNDLYYTLVGNSSLRPETATQADGGVRLGLSPGGRMKVTATAEVYHNRVTDKIVAVPTASQFRWMMYNIGKADILGAEASAGFFLPSEAAPSDGVSLLLKYTFQKALDLSNPGWPSYKGQIPYVPRHSGSASLSWTHGGWRADVSAVASGRRYSYSTNLPEYEVGSYVTVDAWLSRTFAIPRAGELTARLSISNLLDRQYEIVASYPMPGTGVLAGLEYSF